MLYQVDYIEYNIHLFIHFHTFNKCVQNEWLDGTPIEILYS